MKHFEKEESSRKIKFLEICIIILFFVFVLHSVKMNQPLQNGDGTITKTDDGMQPISPFLRKPSVSYIYCKIIKLPNTKESNHNECYSILFDNLFGLKYCQIFLHFVFGINTSILDNDQCRLAFKMLIFLCQNIILTW